MVTKEILLAIMKEKDLQKRTTLPFGTLSPYYHILKDQTFLNGLQTFLRSRRRTMRSKSPSPVFIPSPGPSEVGGTPIIIPEAPPSAPATVPPPPIGPAPVILPFIHPSSSLPKEVIPLPLIVPRTPSPPLVDLSPFAPPFIPTPPSPPPVEPSQIATPPLPLVPWGLHRREYSSMEQYKPPTLMDETPDPVNVPLPLSLPTSLPVTQQPEGIPLPPVKKITIPSSLDLIPLPWDIPPFPRDTLKPSPPVTSSLQLPPPVESPPQFPLIVSMTPSRTTPLLPKHPLTKELPGHAPTPPEWKETSYVPFTGKRKELSLEIESPPIALPPCRPPRPAPIHTTPLFKKHKEFVWKEGPTWKESQSSLVTGK